ncbi:MAG: RDD family protein [Paludisphaera borealis]|uniref:RDD family protein n=1 Tax=Paludisphaera borealis TaxID=1387353 RepID=UPI00284F1823|nr:RDD family protein [Paludisphaera borealis]MDR3617709.1 RDD family protein [Paludisphaera borealis]
MNDHRKPLGQRVLTIRTPENIELTYALAGPGSRAAAYLVDVFAMMIIGQIFVNLLISVVTALLSGLGPGSQTWVAAIGGLVAFSLYNGYFILFEWLWNGQTPGKRLLHVRVIRQGGYALSVFDTLLRNLLRVIDFLPLFYGVGLVSMLLTRDSQRLGDLVAGTLVVYQEPVETESLLPVLPAASAAEPPLPASALAAVPGEVVELVGIYLRSREEMTPRPRQEIAVELADLIHEASGLDPQAGQSVESFLTSIVRQSEQALPSSTPPPVEAELLS